MIRFIINSLQHSVRASWRLHLAAIMTVSLCMGLVVFSFGGARSIREWSRSLDSSMRLLVQVDAQQAQAAQAAITNIQGVKDVNIMGRDAVAAAVGRVLGLESSDGLEALALPTMVRVIPTGGSEGLIDLAEKISVLQGVNAVEYGQRWLSRFQATSQTLVRACFVLALLLLGAAMALLTTVFTLILYNRRNELEIMVLVGASPAHIFVPVFIEGILQAAVGSALAVGVARGVWQLIHDELVVFGASLQLAQGLQQEIGFLVVGLLLGGICALIAMVQVLGNLGDEE